VNPDDLLKARVRVKAERERAPHIEIPRPAFDDAQDRRVRLAADQARDPVAGDASQGLDLLRDRRADARHAEVAARAEVFSIDF